jgi:metal-responsive CopG/Arc/MetJ family transcriptional regulator
LALGFCIGFEASGEVLMKNVQISFDEGLLETVDHIAVSEQLTRSALVREAVRTWIRQKKSEEFERQWIAKLKETPQDTEASEAWLEAETWSDG